MKADKLTHPASVDRVHSQRASSIKDLATAMRTHLTACLLVCISGFSGCVPTERAVIPNTEATASVTVPEGDGPFPAVVLMHGCSGIDPEVKKGNDAHVRHLLSEGFVTLILDSFGPRRLQDVVCNEGDEMWAAYRYRQHDAVAALRYLRSQPFVDEDNIFVMGQSHGGGVVLRLAKNRNFPVGDRFRAAVAYYPWCGNLRERLHTPVLVLIGEDDDWTPAPNCIEGKRHAHGAPFELQVYENAHHSFDLPMGGPYRYKGHTVAGHSGAAFDSRKRMVAWFHEHQQAR